MVLIGGKFQLIKNVDFVEHLVALGIPEEKAKVANSLKPILEITVQDKDVIFTSISEQFNSTSILKLDEEVDETIAVDIKIKSIAKLDGNKITISSRGRHGETGSRLFEFFDKELIMTLSSETEGVPVAKRYYDKIE